MEREDYMALALDEARLARDEGEVPVGCVIVREGVVIGRGHNRREGTQNALAHAEIAAIRAACERQGSWRLSDCTLYVTLEPCAMCAGAILAARIARVCYGAREPNYGACGSVCHLFLENFPHTPQLYGGILAAESRALLAEFFAARRKKMPETDNFIIL